MVVVLSGRRRVLISKSGFDTRVVRLSSLLKRSKII